MKLLRHVVGMIAFALVACGTQKPAGAELFEGSVDACVLLDAGAVERALGSGARLSGKGTIPETWGSSCRWSTADGREFVSVVAHTKHGAQTFRSLRQYLPKVKDRPDLGAAYQSETKLYLLARGTYVTLEWSEAARALPAATADQLARTVLARLDEAAKTQAVHRE